jgi:hypothetical protein
VKVNKRTVLKLALACIILAVTAIGNSYALTWDGQSDVTRLNSSSTAVWYAYIGSWGTAYDDSPLSWNNGLNHAASGLGSVMPAVYYGVDVYGEGFEYTNDRCSYTINYGQAWGINEITDQHVIKDVSGNFMKVKHRYYDQSGNSLLASTTFVYQNYTIY